MYVCTHSRRGATGVVKRERERAPLAPALRCSPRRRREARRPPANSTRACVYRRGGGRRCYAVGDVHTHARCSLLLSAASRAFRIASSRKYASTRACACVRLVVGTGDSCVIRASHNTRARGEREARGCTHAPMRRRKIRALLNNNRCLKFQTFIVNERFLPFSN